MGVDGLVLAAGGGTRFRGPEGSSFKLLADLGGRPVLQWVVDAVCAVDALDRVVVVVGAFAAAVSAGVRFGRAEVVECPEWAEGQSASLRCGLRALAGAERVIVTLGDQPLITPELVTAFVDCAPRTRAVYGGRPGHPVVLGPDEMEALAGLRGDVGARDLLRGGPVKEVGHLCSGRDVDTQDDLEEVRNEARAVI